MPARVSPAADSSGDGARGWCWRRLRQPPGRGGRPSSAPPPARTVRRPERLLVGLLRVTAVLSDSSWPALLYALFVHVIGALGVVVHMHQQGASMLLEGRKIVEVIADTGYMGLVFGLMLTTTACSFGAGRRRCGAVFKTIGRLLDRVAELPAYERHGRQLHRYFIWLLLAILGLVLYQFAMTLHVLKTSAALNTASQQRIIHVFSECLYPVLFLAVHLVLAKFLIAGLQLLAGFQAVTEQLRSTAEEKQSPDDTVLQKLRSLHDELSDAFAAVTKAMTYELVAVMTYGTLSSTSISLNLIRTVVMGRLDGGLFQTFLHIASASVAVSLPCEVAQRVLDTVGQTQHVLLMPQWLASQWEQELGQFREKVNRDLSTLGDLGLFRLKRSSILSIMATVLTYIIVLVQFYLTELTSN